MSHRRAWGPSPLLGVAPNLAFRPSAAGCGVTDADTLAGVRMGEPVVVEGVPPTPPLDRAAPPQRRSTSGVGGPPMGSERPLIASLRSNAADERLDVDDRLPTDEEL